MPADWAPNYPVKSNGRDDVTYTTANGETVPNQGEKILNIVTQEGKRGKLKFQLAPVNQALCSVSGICAANNRVVFEEGYGFIQNKSTGEKTWLRNERGIYVLDADIAPSASGFTWQGQA